MDSLSLEGFHTQLDCKLTYGNKKQTHAANTLILYKVLCSKQNRTNRNDEKYSQTGTTVIIHTNHEGARATAIMLRSIAAGPSWRSPVITVKKA